MFWLFFDRVEMECHYVYTLLSKPTTHNLQLPLFFFFVFFFSHNIILITLSSLTIPSSLVEKTQFALSGFSNFQISQNIIKYQIYLNKESIRNETKEMTIMQGALVFVLFNLNSFTRLTPYLQCDVRIN